MATQPHHDGDQTKKPDETQQPPKTPTPKKPPVPNMELDEPEDALIVDEMIDEEAIPVLEVVDDEPIVLAESDIVVAEVVEAAPASDVVLGDEALRPHPADSPPVLSQPPTGVRTGPLTPLPTESVSAPVEPTPAMPEVVEATPASDVIAAEEVVEDVEPLSDIIAEEVIEEALPASEVKAASDVLGVEEIVEAEAGSAPKSAELFVESVDEPSSATRKAEAVLDDEIIEAEEADEVLDSDIEAIGSSAVLFDELTEATSDAKKSVSSGKMQTIPFDSPTNGAKKSDDELVTEEELLGSSEASAVDLSDIPARKGSSVVGIDKLAEALESGVEVRADSPEPIEADEASVVFDELLEDDSDEHVVTPPKGKKAAAMSDSTEMEGGPLEGLGAKDELSAGKKKGKQTALASDDVDLESLFSEDEAEPTHAVGEADDVDATVAFDKTSSSGALKGVAEDEAAEIFGEETEASESLLDDDVGLAAEEEKSTTKKGKGKKKAAVAEEDEEATEAIEDEDDSAVRRKKGKKKELAAVASSQKRPSMALRWLGGMFIGGFLVAALGAAAVLFAPEAIGLVKSDTTKTPAGPTIDPAKVKADQARALKDQEELKKTLAQLDTAKADADAKDKKAIDLADKLTTATGAKDIAEKQLQVAKLEKMKAEKETDAVADALAKAKLIEDKSKLDVATLPNVLKGLGDDKATLDTVNKLLKDAEVKDAGDKGVKSILDAKKDADDQLTAVNKALEDEKIKDQGAKGILALADARNKAAKEGADLDASIKAAVKEFVDAKIVPAGGDPRKQLVEGAKMARLKSESPLAITIAQLGQQLASVGTGAGKAVEKSFDAAKLAAELGFYKAREPLIQSPQQKMDTDVALLQDRARNNPKELAAMTREADWVLAPESKSTAEARGKARYVQGLALRNLGQYDAARAAFAGALKLAGGGWTESVKKSARELTDPNAYYVPRIVAYGDAGQFNAALAEANTALKVMPGDARLHALRGLIHFELIRGQGAKTGANDQKAIRADAVVAAKDAKLAAESAYIVGLLEEELGNYSEAEKLFRQALKTHEGPDDTAGRYRVALARLLLRDRPEGAAPAAPPAAPVDEKKDAAAPKSVERTIVMHPWSLLAVSIVIAQPGDDEVEDPAMVARLKETIDLANQLIASKTDKIKGQGYLILGSALSKQGKRTEGIKEYAKGMKLLYPGIESDELAKLINEHPAFQQADAGGNDPIVAERHYGEGYHLYWAGKYAAAEAQFKKALGLFDKDARYQYYLGLAQYQQKTKAKRDAAYYSWEQGARLEAKAATNPFAVREINSSLERVQGNERQLLNSYRNKSAEEK